MAGSRIERLVGSRVSVRAPRVGGVSVNLYDPQDRDVNLRLLLRGVQFDVTVLVVLFPASDNRSKSRVSSPGRERDGFQPYGKVRLSVTGPAVREKEEQARSEMTRKTPYSI